MAYEDLDPSGNPLPSRPTCEHSGVLALGLMLNLRPQGLEIAAQDSLDLLEPL